MASSVLAETGLGTIIDLDRTFLPVGRMRQISRVIEVRASGISGEIELGPEHPVWPEHFPGDPIFPGTLMIEGAGQLVALWAWSQGARGRPRLVRTSAEFLNPVVLGSRGLLLEAEVRRKRQFYAGRIEVHSEEVHIARIEALLVVLP